MSLRNIGILFFIFFAVFSYFLIYSSRKAGAQTAVFYSTSCLGGWKDTDKAVGVPDIVSGEHEEYSDDNSASVYNTNAEIYCGGFQGEIPNDALKKKVVVKFSWSTEGPSTNSEKAKATSSENGQNEGPVLDQGEVEGAEIVNTEIVPKEEVIIPEAKDEPTIEEMPTEPVSEPEPVGEEATSDDTINYIFKTAHAADMNNSINDSNWAMLEVLYTLDGERWHHLGNIQEINNDTTLELPAEILTTEDGLQNVQISLRTLSTFDDIPKIYLDSVWLAVEYEMKDVSSAKGVKILLLPQEDIENHINSWIVSQQNISVDEIKIEDYENGQYLVIINYNYSAGAPEARIKLIASEDPETDSQAFISSLGLERSIISVNAIRSYSGREPSVALEVPNNVLEVVVLNAEKKTLAHNTLAVLDPNDLFSNSKNNVSVDGQSGNNLYIRIKLKDINEFSKNSITTVCARKEVCPLWTAWLWDGQNENTIIPASAVYRTEDGFSQSMTFALPSHEKILIAILYE